MTDYFPNLFADQQVKTFFLKEVSSQLSAIIFIYGVVRCFDLIWLIFFVFLYPSGTIIISFVTIIWKFGNSFFSLLHDLYLDIWSQVWRFVICTVSSYFSLPDHHMLFYLNVSAWFFFFSFRPVPFLSSLMIDFEMAIWWTFYTCVPAIVPVGDA